MLITTGDLKKYIPDDYSIRYKSRYAVEVINRISDGDFVQKNKNHNRTLLFSLRFDPLTAQTFASSLNSKGKVRIFDLLEFSGFLEVLINEVEYEHNFVKNFNCVQFDISATEILPFKTTFSPPLSALSTAAQVVMIVQKLKQANLTNRIISLTAKLITAPLFTLLNLKVFAQNRILSIKENLRLIKLNFEKSFADSVLEAAALAVSANAGLADVVGDLDAPEVLEVLAALDMNENELGAFVSNQPPQQKEAFVFASSYSVYSFCGTMFNMDFTRFTVAQLLKFQEKICQKLDFFTQMETSVIIDENITPPSVFLLETAVKIEKELLSARQKRTEILGQFSDIVPLVFRFYEPKTPIEFERALNLFISDNNIYGDLLFGLPSGRKVTYYV